MFKIHFVESCGPPVAWVFLAFFFCSHCQMLAAADAQDELLDFLRQAHRASVESIHTFSCRAKWGGDQSISGTPGTFAKEGEYYRSGNTIRSREVVDQFVVDVLIEGGICRSMQRDMKKASPSTGAIAPAKYPLPGCDVWQGALFSFPGSTENLDELLARPNVRVKSVVRKTGQGADEITIMLSEKTNEMQIVFDGKANYLVRKHILWLQGRSGTKRLEDEILSFKEIKASIYFPEKVVQRYFYNNNLAIQSFQTFSDIRVNEPIPSSRLRLDFPPDMLVTDGINDKVYKVSRDGQSFEPSGRVLVKNPPFTQAQAREQAGPSQEESKGLTRWLLPAAVPVLLVAGVLWLRKKVAKSGG